MVEKDDGTAEGNSPSGETGDVASRGPNASKDAGKDDKSSAHRDGAVRVPVNEDYLFDVDIKDRELAPAYWLGPIYDVRRGTWFYQEGTTLRPCDENLATQLEEGFLKVKPWRVASANEKSQSTEEIPSSENQKTGDAADSVNNSSDIKKERSIPAKFQLQTQRLFGTYMSSVVTYQDANTAWVLTDDFLSRMSSTVYQRFAGGGHLGGTKIVRGYSEPSKERKDPKKEGDTVKKPNSAKEDVDELRKKSRRSQSVPNAPILEEDKEVKVEPEPRLKTLERKMSNFVSSQVQDQAQEEAMARKRDEDEIIGDYVDEDGQDQAREIEHLILVVS